MNQTKVKIMRGPMADGLLMKVVLAAAVSLTGRFLLAQAPGGAGSESLAREEVDANGVKSQTPSATLRNPKNVGTLNTLRSTVRNVLNGSASLPDNRANFRGFFQSYLFPMMTVEDGLKNAAKDRQDLFRDLQNARSPEAHREVVDMALRAMTTIVQDKAYRPAARYNAMLLISQLNDQEPNAFVTPQTLPEPMRAALQVIMQQFKDADNDEIKIAALLGLSRHLEWDSYRQTPMPPATRSAIVKDLIALAETKDVPPTRDAEVHSWMRRRAIDALTLACTAKADAEIAAALDRLLKDESNSPSVRLAVAAALGRISIQPPAKIDAVATAKDLGYLALVACDAELTRAEAQRKADYEHYARLMGTYSGEEGSGGYGGGMPGMASSGMGGPGRIPGMPGGGGMTGSEGVVRTRPTPGGTGGEIGGGYGTESGYTNPAEADPKHYQMEYLRRRIRQQLYAVQLGLAGTDDFVESKTTASGSAGLGGANTSSSGGSGAGNQGDKKGMHGIAKPGDEQTQVKKIYYRVRKLAEVTEQAGESDLYQFLKDMRRELKALELAVGKRLPPAGAAPAGAPADDAPAAGPAGKAGPAKGGPGKGPAVPGKAKPMPGKAAARPQPQVFGQPRMK